MYCKKCKKSIEPQSAHLVCYQCNCGFHFGCIASLTKSDFDYIQTSKTNWKCYLCDKSKSKRGDETPITPTSDKDKPLFSSTQSENSDSEKSEAGVKQKILCMVCKKGYSFNSYRLECVFCKNTSHLKCMGVNKEDYDKIKSNWTCSVCAGVGEPISQSQVQTLLARDTGGPLIQVLSEMKLFREEVQRSTKQYSDSLNAFRKEVVDKNQEFTNALNSYSEWIEDNGKQIKQLSEGLAKMMKDYDEIRQENLNLKKTNDILTKRVNFLEQSSRDKMVEIHGVPFKKDENITEIVKQISDAIGFGFEEAKVDTCYRLPARVASPSIQERPGGIIMRFVRKTDKDEFMILRRKKRNLNSRDLGYMEGDASPVYINDSLTQESRKLFRMAKEVKQNKQFTYLWVRNGRIFMRKNPGDRYVVIEGPEDLSKLQ